MKWIKFLALAALAMSISACAAGTATKDMAQWSVSAPGDYQTAVGGADWNSAKVIEITLFDDQFSPMLLKLKQGQPYVLRLTSKEPAARLVIGSDFLDSLAVGSVSGNDEITKASVVRGIVLDPNQPREIRIVPMKSGRYEFRRAGQMVFSTFGNVFEPFGMFKTGAYGVAYVD